jgi:hypothetical protein
MVEGGELYGILDECGEKRLVRTWWSVRRKGRSLLSTKVSLE